jgi:hypothetical protein
MPGGFLISGSSFSSSESSISGTSGGRGGSLMMIGSPGGRPGGLGKGSGRAYIRGLLVRTADRCTVDLAGIGSFSRHDVAGQAPVLCGGPRHLADGCGCRHL